MKILHTSDWHLGQNFMGKSRVEEHEAFLSWLLEIIKEKEIEVLLVSGDIFDTGTPPNYSLEIYYNFLKELSNIKTQRICLHYRNRRGKHTSRRGRHRGDASTQTRHFTKASSGGG